MQQKRFALNYRTFTLMNDSNSYQIKLFFSFSFFIAFKQQQHTVFEMWKATSIFESLVYPNEQSGFKCDLEFLRNITMYSEITNRFDSETTDQTAAFLSGQIGNIRQDQQDYQVLAAAAIVGESKRLLDVSRQRQVRIGISIESVMRHIGKLSKEFFLEVLNRQYKKWREAPHWLQTKINNVEINYRIYKKYRMTFQQLCNKNRTLSQHAKFNLMAIFWVLYLYVKNTNPEIDNTDRYIQLLNALFIFAFNEIITPLPHQQIETEFKLAFSKSQPLTEEDYTLYKNLMISKLNHVHTWRYENSRINLKQLVMDENYTERYLDDISNQYDKFKAFLPENHVDEISFLELTKTLTPLTIQRNVTCKGITKKINFANDDDDDDLDNGEDNDDEDRSMQPQSQQIFPNYQIPTAFGASRGRLAPVSPFRQRQPTRYDFEGSPLISRTNNLSWVNRIINKPYHQEISQMKFIYQKYTNRQYNKYQHIAFEKILASIKQFSPDCMDFQKRQNNIYVFFIHFVIKIVESHSQMENLLIFNTDGSFNSLLCLATDLFNYAYQSLQSSYRKYCSIFQISLMEGHKPINWFGSCGQMPKNIQTFLYDLQKRILIFELWEDNLGYSLICEGDNQFFHNQVIIKRLRKHVDERTEQLCHRMTKSQKQIVKIINLVRFILDHRQVVLHKQKIDQIIVCSISSILSINQSIHKVSLQDIFRHYTNLNYGFYTNRSLEDEEGNKIDLNDYYNNIFLPAIDEIINKEENIANILSTPVRLEYKNRRDRGLQMTPSAIRYPQIPILGGGKRIKADSFDNNPSIYRKRIVNSLNNLNIEEHEDEDNDEGSQSPSFGGGSGPTLPQGLFKTFSFGNLGNIDKF